METEHGYLRVEKWMWDDHLQENWFCVSWWRICSKSAEWKEVVAGEKIKFEMKIMQGTRKVKWSKRREEQNMWNEIHYSIKSSDLICTNLLDKKWMLKSYAGKKISQIREKTIVDFILVASCIYHFFFFFLNFWICLWWCQMLTLSDLRQPAQDFQRPTVPGCLLQLLI